MSVEVRGRSGHDGWNQRRSEKIREDQRSTIEPRDAHLIIAELIQHSKFAMPAICTLQTLCMLK